MSTSCIGRRAGCVIHRWAIEISFLLTRNQHSTLSSEA
jgi:hypothetical protein